MDAKTLGNTPAFPCGADGGCGPWPGMTLRQYYAGLAMPAELAAGEPMKVLFIGVDCRRGIAP